MKQKEEAPNWLIEDVSDGSEEAKQVLLEICQIGGMQALNTLISLGIHSQLLLQLNKNYYSDNLAKFSQDLCDDRNQIVQNINELTAPLLGHRLTLLNRLGQGNPKAYRVLFDILDIEREYAYEIWQKIADLDLADKLLLQLYVDGFSSNIRAFIYALENLDNGRITEEIDRLNLKNQS